MYKSKGTAPAVADWLNPRRYEQCRRLLRYLHWHGGKNYLTREEYLDIRHEAELDRIRADQAIDDLHALGLVEIRQAGTSYSVVLLGTDLDAACGRNARPATSAQTTTPTAPRPRVVVAPARKGGRR
jgi:hypothetical protein